MNSSDSAEEFVKICLDGIDHAIRIMGVGAKNIGAMLIALSKEKKQTKENRLLYLAHFRICWGQMKMVELKLKMNLYTKPIGI